MTRGKNTNDLLIMADTVIGRSIKELRIKAGMTQTQLGERLGVTFQQIQKYERGLNRISVSQLMLLSHLFDVPVQTLIMEDNVSIFAKPLLLQEEKLLELFREIKNLQSREMIIGLLETLGSKE